ncbi:MAG: tRNA (adenosine(37)-N6)-threonylcarbamoyltransferase complex transferase subunit TsaD [Syntrophobacteraceae bacterium]|jgi:N6-L-threonylcarbamoyladenine synthase|nr:tRNA (adenosine(37)-N6)-threonylcarbamoyltransferase complex transferase subunit TsaD [Syntrophobacteraceae bacterium]
MLVLGIETSCDETAAAIVEDGKTVWSDVVASQIAVHSPYGGVVPELASRQHVQAILVVIQQALERARLSRHQLDAIAVTRGPGLVGALLVGLGAAKAMAYALGIPLIAVNHLEGHMHAAFMGRDPLGRPFACLVVSGGHSALYLVDGEGRGELLGCTRDDAAGEAFDKVAKLLGLGYPGGVAIDRLARQGNRRAFSFPRALMEKGSLDFSFSGLKTSVATFVRKHGPPPERGQAGAYRLEDLVASFQEAVVDVLVKKIIRAAQARQVTDVAVVGGVAANGRLRELLIEETAGNRLHLHLPEPRYCTDNAVMIAAAGYHAWKRQGFCQDPLEVDAVSRWT